MFLKHNQLLRLFMKVIYIASCGHSGSTILDIALSTHPRAIGLGEVFTLIKRYNVKGKEYLEENLCACGKKTSKCEVWRTLIYELNKNKIKNYLSLYYVISEKANKDIIIDSSKELAPLTHILKNDENNTFLIVHLIRDPFGVVCSYKRKYGKVLKHIVYWNWYNIKILLSLRRAKKNLKVIGILYDDFAQNPEKTVEGIYQKIGETYDKNYLKNINIKSHQGEGNRVRTRQIDKITLNKEFIKELTFTEKMLIGLLSSPIYIFLKLYYKISNKVKMN